MSGPSFEYWKYPPRELIIPCFKFENFTIKIDTWLNSMTFDEKVSDTLILNDILNVRNTFSLYCIEIKQERLSSLDKQNHE